MLKRGSNCTLSHLITMNCFKNIELFRTFLITVLLKSTCAPSFSAVVVSNLEAQMLLIVLDTAMGEHF